MNLQKPISYVYRTFSNKTVEMLLSSEIMFKLKFKIKVARVFFLISGENMNV